MDDYRISPDEILMSDGSRISRSDLDEYNRQKKEREAAQRREAIQREGAVRDAEKKRGNCPLVKGTKKACKGDLCALGGPTGCRMATFPSDHRTDGLYCPMNDRHVCENTCALYRGGCTL